MDEKKYKLICVRKGKTNYARTNNRKNVTLGSYRCYVLFFPVYRHYLGCTSPGGSIVQMRSINEFWPIFFGLQLMIPRDSALLVAAVQGP